MRLAYTFLLDDPLDVAVSSPPSLWIVETSLYCNLALCVFMISSCWYPVFSSCSCDCVWKFLRLPPLPSCRVNPSYLPADTRSEKLIMRMVHCMTWDTDESIYHGFEDVWTTPEFFQAVKKGDSEDHAILMVCLAGEKPPGLCLLLSASCCRIYVGLPVLLCGMRVPNVIMAPALCHSVTCFWGWKSITARRLISALERLPKGMSTRGS